tara:strand:- start:1098 stop:1925 length:828 start_codon:yes stop_codon:yes gene_type:complete
MKKISNCKSRRSTDVIIHLYNTTNLSSSQIGEQVGLSGPTVRRIGKENNISLKRLERRKTYQNSRNEKLIAAIRKGELTYKEIGKKYNITKQRVSQFAKTDKVSRWEESREKISSLIVDVKEDIEKGLTYKGICEKYGDNYYLKQTVKGGLHTHLRKKRDKEIVSQYKQTTAKSIISDISPLLDSPQRIVTTHQIYNISVKNGYKKYPKIGNRSKGSFFESDRVIKLIKELKNKNYSYRKIADSLNEKGWKSPMGKTYSSANVLSKHKLIKKYNL